MSSVPRRHALLLDSERWAKLPRAALDRAALQVIAPWVLLALARFGGQILSPPTASLRLLVLGAWSWIGLAAGLWALARLIGGGAGLAPWQAMYVAARAHGALLAVAFAAFLLANLAQVFGVGRFVALLSVGVWMPTMLVVAVRTLVSTTWPRAVMIALVPWALWIAVIGPRVWVLIGHLL